MPLRRSKKKIRKSRKDISGFLQVKGLSYPQGKVIFASQMLKIDIGLLSKCKYDDLKEKIPISIAYSTDKKNPEIRKMYRKMASLKKEPGKYAM